MTPNQAIAEIVTTVAAGAIDRLRELFTPVTRATHHSAPRVDQDDRSITATAQISVTPYPPEQRFELSPYVDENATFDVTVAVVRHTRPATEPVTLPVDLARALTRMDAGLIRDGWTVVANDPVRVTEWRIVYRLVIADQDGRLYAADYSDSFVDPQPWEEAAEVVFHPAVARPITVIEYVTTAQVPAPPLGAGRQHRGAP